MLGQKRMTLRHSVSGSSPPPPQEQVECSGRVGSLWARGYHQFRSQLEGSRRGLLWLARRGWGFGQHFSFSPSVLRAQFMRVRCASDTSQLVSFRAHSPSDQVTKDARHFFLGWLWDADLDLRVVCGNVKWTLPFVSAADMGLLNAFVISVTRYSYVNPSNGKSVEKEKKTHF